MLSQIRPARMFLTRLFVLLPELLFLVLQQRRTSSSFATVSAARHTDSYGADSTDRQQDGTGRSGSTEADDDAQELGESSQSDREEEAAGEDADAPEEANGSGLKFRVASEDEPRESTSEQERQLPEPATAEEVEQGSSYVGLAARRRKMPARSRRPRTRHSFSYAATSQDADQQDARSAHKVTSEFMKRFARNMRLAVLSDSKGDMDEKKRLKMIHALQLENREDDLKGRATAEENNSAEEDLLAPRPETTPVAAQVAGGQEDNDLDLPGEDADGGRAIMGTSREDHVAQPGAEARVSEREETDWDGGQGEGRGEDETGRSENTEVDGADEDALEHGAPRREINPHQNKHGARRNAQKLHQLRRRTKKIRMLNQLVRSSNKQLHSASAQLPTRILSLSAYRKKMHACRTVACMNAVEKRRPRDRERDNVGSESDRAQPSPAESAALQSLRTTQGKQEFAAADREEDDTFGQAESTSAQRDENADVESSSAQQGNLVNSGANVFIPSAFRAPRQPPREKKRLSPTARRVKAMRVWGAHGDVEWEMRKRVLQLDPAHPAQMLRNMMRAVFDSIEFFFFPV
ncbi:unnamed protein product [Amoebophrya sp. A120]|nr:unnamed protein product [Amoebophrya sp. A120]|eukprot:GSA120T00006022001.1